MVAPDSFLVMHSGTGNYQHGGCGQQVKGNGGCAVAEVSVAAVHAAGDVSTLDGTTGVATVSQGLVGIAFALHACQTQDFTATFNANSITLNYGVGGKHRVLVELHSAERVVIRHHV